MVGWVVALAGSGCGEGSAGTENGPAPTVERDPMYTLDDFCSATAPTYCAARQSCCERAVGFEAAECERRYLKRCDEAVAAVRAGWATLDQAAFHACERISKPYLAQCGLNLTDSYRYFRDSEICARVFQGNKQELERCAHDWECAEPEGDTNRSSCATDPFGLLTADRARVCTISRIVGERERCRLYDVCDEGLYCTAQASPAEETTMWLKEGVCEQLEGASCALPGLSDCGRPAVVGFLWETSAREIVVPEAHPPVAGLADLRTHYCDEASQRCTRFRRGGEQCTFNLQCEAACVGENGVPCFDRGTSCAGRCADFSWLPPIVDGYGCGTSDLCDGVTCSGCCTESGACGTSFPAGGGSWICAERGRKGASVDACPDDYHTTSCGTRELLPGCCLASGECGLTISRNPTSDCFERSLFGLPAIPCSVPVCGGIMCLPKCDDFERCENPPGHGNVCCTEADTCGVRVPTLGSTCYEYDDGTWPAVSCPGGDLLGQFHPGEACCRKGGLCGKYIDADGDGPDEGLEAGCVELSVLGEAPIPCTPRKPDQP